MANAEIKQRAKEKNVRLWEIAARLGMYDSTLSKKLRFELSDDMKNQIIKAIDAISTEKGSEATENK